jgi:hypothetical protein
MVVEQTGSNSVMFINSLEMNPLGRRSSSEDSLEGDLV